MAELRGGWNKGDVLFLLSGKRYWVVCQAEELGLVDMETAETASLAENDEVVAVLPADKVCLYVHHVEDTMYL